MNDSTLIFGNGFETGDTTAWSVGLTAGTVFLMWLGEQIDEYGIGNGISLIIMAGIAALLYQLFISYVRREELRDVIARFRARGIRVLLFSSRGDKVSHIGMVGQ